jgi:hypothetical protein
MGIATANLGLKQMLELKWFFPREGTGEGRMAFTLVVYARASYLLLNPTLSG